MSNSDKLSVCVDTSFLIQLLTRGQYVREATALWQTWHNAERHLIVPTLFFYEVSNVLHQQVRHRYLLPEEAVAALETAFAFNITLYGDHDLHHQALRIAQHLKLPATYDAHYLALCERMGAEFWTADRRLYNSVHTSLPWVHLLSTP